MLRRKIDFYSILNFYLSIKRKLKIHLKMLDRLQKNRQVIWYIKIETSSK